MVGSVVGSTVLTVTAVVLRALGVDSNRVGVVGIPIIQSEQGLWQSGKTDSQFSLGLLRQCVLGDRLEGLFNVDGLLGGCLKVWNVALGLTPCHCSFLGYLVWSAMYPVERHQ